MPVATVVLDRYDKPAFTIFEERRYEIPLDQVSPHLLQAVIAIEDQRFRGHGGVDLWRIAGSAWANLRSTSLEQGGSTITQQLAKLSFLSPDKTFRRKLKEAYLAVRIELAFTKDEILETYLNKVYFGDGYFGAEAASRGYFSKHAKDLSIGEAALLAGLIQRPSATTPEPASRSRDRSEGCCARPDGRVARHRPRNRGRNRQDAGGARERVQERADGLVLQAAGHTRARRAVRLGHRVTRRTEGVHVVRPGRASGRREVSGGGAHRDRKAQGFQASGRRQGRGAERQRIAGLPAGRPRGHGSRPLARFARSSAGGTSARASSTASRRRIASPVRRSSRSSMPPRSSRATRRRRSSPTSTDPSTRRKGSGCRTTGTRPACRR